MKTIISILMIITLSALDGVSIYSTDKDSKFGGMNITSCPEHHEKAEEDLKGYLAREKNVEDLRKKYDMSIDHTAQTKIYSLHSKREQDVCKKLIENNFRWLENASTYSIFQVANSYFIVTYSITEKGEFDRNSIVIVDSTYEAVAVVIDFSTSARDN